MAENIFKDTYEEFVEAHPEYKEGWREAVEPVVIAEDDGIFGFLFGYLLV